MMLRRGECRIISTSTKRGLEIQTLHVLFHYSPLSSLPFIMGSGMLLFAGLIRDIKERENINRR